ncbi:hypothetical protein AB7828_03540 [Tardiphaga sp. 215_C5_N2_1]|uniref:hypothetical protein n=1 Tax=Tardiphaga sp. 215_C5_N2_1 TaxID=3240774 RepID=UPI003F8C463F
MKRTVVVAFLFSAVITPAFSQSICTGLLTYTGRDLSTEVRENSIAASIYSEHCEGNTSKKSNSTNVGLEAVVKAVPVKFSFGGSSNEEKLNNFCKVYDQRRAEFSSEQIDRSTVVRSSLEAFNTCIRLAASDIYFNPLIGKTNVAIDIKRGGEDAAIVGVHYDNSLVTCNLPAEDGKGPAVVADKNINRALKTAYLPLACERLAQPGPGGTKLYPAVEITVATSRGTLLLPVGADAAMPIQYASEIGERIKQLETGIAKAGSRKMSCDLVQNVGTGHYPMVEAKIPASALNNSVLTGGGCLMNQYPALPHNGTLLQNRPLDDRTGWKCAAGDPPSIPLNITVTAYAIYCGVKD